MRTEGALIATAALMFNRSRPTIWSVLSRYPELFDEPRYTRGARHPRRLRVLSERDIVTLRDLFTWGRQQKSSGTQTLCNERKRAERAQKTGYAQRIG